MCALVLTHMTYAACVLTQAPQQNAGFAFSCGLCCARVLVPECALEQESAATNSKVVASSDSRHEKLDFAAERVSHSAIPLLVLCTPATLGRIGNDGLHITCQFMNS